LGGGGLGQERGAVDEQHSCVVWLPRPVLSDPGRSPRYADHGGRQGRRIRRPSRRPTGARDLRGAAERPPHKEHRGARGRGAVGRAGQRIARVSWARGPSIAPRAPRYTARRGESDACLEGHRHADPSQHGGPQACRHPERSRGRGARPETGRRANRSPRGPQACRYAERSCCPGARPEIHGHARRQGVRVSSDSERRPPRPTHVGTSSTRRTGPSDTRRIVDGRPGADRAVERPTRRSTAKRERRATEGTSRRSRCGDRLALEGVFDERPVADLAGTSQAPAHQRAECKRPGRS